MHRFHRNVLQYTIFGGVLLSLLGSGIATAQQPQPTATPFPVAQETYSTALFPTMIFFPGQAHQVTLSFFNDPEPDFNVTVAFYRFRPDGVYAPTMDAHWDISADLPNPEFEATGFFYYSEIWIPDELTEAEIEGIGRGEAVKWEYLGGSMNRINNYVVVPGITGFSQWTLGPSEAFLNALPTTTTWGMLALLGGLTFFLGRRRTNSGRLEGVLFRLLHGSQSSGNQIVRTSYR